MQTRAGQTATRERPVPAKCHDGAILALMSGLLLFSAQPRALEVTGTWTGILAQGNESSEISLDFSGAGYWVITYTDNRGLTRSTELMTPGQQIRYVPPGGGVQTHVVESIDKQPGHLAYVLRNSFEGTNNGYLTQNYETQWFEFRLTSQGLNTRIESRSSRYFGDQDGPIGGEEAEVAMGILQRAGSQPSTPANDQPADGPEEMAGIKQEMAELSRMQEELSRQLDAMHQNAMGAIRTIEAP